MLLTESWEASLIDHRSSTLAHRRSLIGVYPTGRTTGGRSTAATSAAKKKHRQSDTEDDVAPILRASMRHGGDTLGVVTRAAVDGDAQARLLDVDANVGARYGNIVGSHASSSRFARIVGVM